MSLSSLKIQSLPRFSLNFAANIMASLLMLIGSVRAFEWVKPSFNQFLLFCSLALSSNILFSWLVADTNNHFNEQGLISYLIWPTTMFIAGIILSRRYRNDTLMFVPAILWLTADTLLILLQSLIQFMELQGWLPLWTHGVIAISFMLLFVWQTTSLFWIFAKKLGWRWWEQVSMMIGAVALLWVWQQNVKDQPIFKAQNTAPTLSETAFYHQPVILKSICLAFKKITKGSAIGTLLGWQVMAVKTCSQMRFTKPKNSLTCVLARKANPSRSSITQIHGTPTPSPVAQA